MLLKHANLMRLEIKIETRSSSSRISSFKILSKFKDSSGNDNDENVDNVGGDV